MQFLFSNFSNHGRSLNQSQRWPCRFFLALGCALLLSDMVSSAVLRTRAAADAKLTPKDKVKWLVKDLQGQIRAMQAGIDILKKTGKPMQDYITAAQQVRKAVGVQDAYCLKLSDYATDKTIILALSTPMSQVQWVLVSFNFLISSNVSKTNFSLKLTKNHITGMLWSQ